ncbi:helix-turn-helix transcriptional regulator [Streptomyces sp. NPDC093228]|uniref:helix-turn-helix transcriptional regulator n=1 Tax=unclassified Streptomyces TaxID=2593676 RepID=UPI000741292D|nr:MULTISPECIES: helix-turn-helix transcriptional regulator [unclassified Streptomyces]KUJ37335.1 XRE family transcriptional regulator [Streptomyces sp. NRRL F-5122]MDX3265236.1 helix-turn-helix transcriptional regulator [Streptomyces sp. MI02-2A]
MERNEGLGEFLRARRAAMDPEELGLHDVAPRRVPGLRREELAALAGVSVDYYTRLEQGRPISPSDSVLDALANALQLDPAERSYLNAVARPRSGGRHRGHRAVQKVRPGVHALLARLEGTPALVLGRRTDILVTNRMARALLHDFDAMPVRNRNAARWMVLDEAARSLFADGWEKVASEFVGTLRMDAARHPDDTRTAELVGELSMKSDRFRRWWAAQKVMQFSHHTKQLHHPVVGRLTLHTETLAFPGDPDLTLLTFLADPGSPSDEALTVLSAWATDHGSAGSRTAARTLPLE